MNDVIDVEEQAIDQLDEEARQRRNAAQRLQSQERAQRRAAIEGAALPVLEAARRVQVLAERGGDQAARSKRRQILRGVRAALQLLDAQVGEDEAFARLKVELGIS